jgi:general secretion pathway protein D
MWTHAQQRPTSGGVGGFGGFGGFNINRNVVGGTTSSQYNNNGSVGNATIYVDADTKNIVVISDQPTGEQIRNVIASLDVPKPQVLIKVVFLEVQHNIASDIGVEGGWARNNIGSAMQSSAGDVFGLSGLSSVVTNFNALGQPVSSALSPGASTSAFSSGGFYQIVGSDFQATLRAIAQAGKSQVLSRPSILARDGQLAKIVVGQEVYLPSGVTFTTTGNTTTPIINGSYTQVGIILNVTPFIGENGMVEMILQPQISSVDTSSPGQEIAVGGLLGSPVYAPNLNIRSADTVVVTPDSQTVVIGGLIGNQKSSNQSKVPILGSIPLLGQLFKSSTKTDVKDELLIFLTPHVVQTQSQLAALSNNEKMTLTPKSYSEEELDRFLDKLPVKKSGK